MRNKFSFLSMVVLLAACGGNSSETTVNTANETQVDTAKPAPKTSVENEEAEFMFTTLVINIPSPFDIVGKLPKAGLQFDPALANPVDNATKYVTSTKRGLNYGVYLVDLVYISTNKQFDQIKPYFKTARQMAKNLECADSFDKIAGTRIEQNIDKEDSINKVIDQVYSEMDNYLRSNDRLLTSTEIVVGSWIESQYLTLSLINKVEKNSNNEILFNKVSQEKGTLDKLVELLKEYEKEKALAPVIKDIKEIHEIYLKEVKFNDLDKATVSKLHKKITETRNRIIG